MGAMLDSPEDCGNATLTDANCHKTKKKKKKKKMGDVSV